MGDVHFSLPGMPRQVTIADAIVGFLGSLRS